MRVSALALLLAGLMLRPVTTSGEVPGPLVLSIEQVPELVKARNLHAKAAILNAQAVATDRGFLERSYLPRLESHLGFESFRSGRSDTEHEPVHRTELSLNLYNGGRDTIRQAIIDRSADAAAADATQVLLHEVTKARRSYWQLVASKELQSALQGALATNRKHRDAAVERIAAGLATDADRLEFEIQEVNLEQDLARVGLALLSHEQELRALLGLTDDVKLLTPAVVPHVHEEELLQRDFEAATHSSIRSLLMKEERVEHELRLAERGWRPSVELGASYELYPSREREFDDRDDRDEVVVGATISFQLLDRGERQAEVANRTLQRAALRAEREQSGRELQVEVQNAQRALRVTHDLIHKAERSNKKAGEYLAKVLEGYQRGVNDSPDVLQAAEKALSYAVRLIELRRDYQLARTELLQALEVIVE